MNTAPDPVLARRARIARWVGLAKRVGYSCLLGAIVLFTWAAISGFDDLPTTLTWVALVASCVVLPIPIILGYGLRAAAREDRQRRQEPPSAPQ